MLSIQGPVANAGPVQTTGGLLRWDRTGPAQQSRQWLQRKQRGRPPGVREGAIARHGPGLAPSGTGRPPAAPAGAGQPVAAMTLSTRLTARIVEPPGWGED